MIWYILYPFRGTSEPPLLPSGNPVRRAFYRHGALTARYWLQAMLASVAIGVIFSYPTVFLNDFPSGGMSGLPHHVWTGSISFESRTEKQPDLEMRQIWLQGGYKEALNRSLLDQVFELQDYLFQDQPGLESSSDPTKWGIHSPTVYWDNSRKKLTSDLDPLHTINHHTQNLSVLGLNLQPLSTFAGKSFRSAKLVTADALVVTLINQHNDGIGSLWQRNMAKLSSQPPASWKTGEPRNDTTSSSIYEYKYQPFSFRQSWALTGAYVCIVIYVAVSLKRLKAFKSRFGLVVTAVTQMTTSILASFTICGLLKINLAQVPQEAYPFVVLTIGLENIFRLINAVLAYPPQLATTQRIANGLGDIGHASLASAAQNLAILWILSLFVSPGVAAFCAFASIALLFDFFFLITFFVAVLNVDIKRMELQDSLVRPRARSRRRRSPERRSWIDAVVHGGLPVSTRMAGSAITITFVMALNWHFSDHNLSSSLKTSPWSTPSRKQYLPILGADRAILQPLNSTMGSTSWMRSRTASSCGVAQFMHIVRPGVQSFTARIYDPLIVVTSTANRTGVPPVEDTWLSGLLDIAVRHFYPSSLAVVFVVAFVTVLMNFLLWDERTEAAELEMNILDDGPLMAKTIETSHRLDIFKITSSECGDIATVGIDRTFSIAAKDRSGQSYTKRLISGPESQGEDCLTGHWPISDCMLDDQGDLLCTITQDGSVFLGRVSGARMQKVLGKESQPIFTGFAQRISKTSQDALLIIVYSDGTVLDVMEDGSIVSRVVLERDEGGIAIAVLVDGDLGKNIILLTNLGSVVSYSWDMDAKGWIKIPLATDLARPSVPAPLVRASWLHNVSGLGLVLLCTSDELVFVDTTSLRKYSIIPISDARPHSVRVLHSVKSVCSECGAPACNYLTIAYTNQNHGDLTVVTYTSAVHISTGTAPSSASTGTDHMVPLCLAEEGEGCNVLSKSNFSAFKLKDPGQWESTPQLCLAGVRRPTSMAVGISKPDGNFPASSASKARGRPENGESPLRRRRRISETQQQGGLDGDLEWEGYIYTHMGNYYSVPIKDWLYGAETAGSGVSATAELTSQLYATNLGPVARLGKRSVGVAIGNSVIVVKVVNNPDAEGVQLTSEAGITLSGDATAREGLMGVQVGVRRSASKGKRAVSTGGSSLLMSRRRGRTD